MDTILAIGRTLLFIVVCYQSLLLTEAVLGAEPLHLWPRALVSVINSAFSTYLILFTSFRITYLLFFVLLLVESLILYRKPLIKLICVAQACILCLMCLRGIASALCALSLGVGLDKVSADVSLRLVTVIVSNLAELIGFFALLRYISLINIQIPLKYNLQRRYLLFWLTVYNVFMLLGAEVYAPGGRLSFAAMEHLCLCSFVLLSSCTMPVYTFRLNRAIEIQKKNRSLKLELGAQKQLESTLMRDAVCYSSIALAVPSSVEKP